MEGEPFLFEEIYEAYFPKIRRYLTSLVGEKEAEDLAQETFIKVSQALDTFKGQSTFSTWLYRIAANAAIDRMRSPAFKSASQQTSIEDLEETGAELEEQDAWTGDRLLSIEQQSVQNYMDQCLRGYIAKLPENYRMVLALSELEGLSNQEIADVLELSLNTVKIRLHRARAKLREDLLSGCEYYWAEELKARLY